MYSPAFRITSLCLFNNSFKLQVNFVVCNSSINTISFTYPISRQLSLGVLLLLQAQFSFLLIPFSKQNCNKISNLLYILELIIIFKNIKKMIRFRDFSPI